MKTFIRIIVGILASMMLLASASCDSCKGTRSDTTKAPVDGTTVPGTSLLELTVKDYGGETITILWPETHTDGHFVNNEIAVAQSSADPIDNAVYKRNMRVETAYNVKIESILSNVTAIPKDVKTQHLAGEVEFDALCTQVLFMTPIAIEGVLKDYNDLEYYSEDQPWWDHDMMQDFAVANYRYFGLGDIIISDNFYPFCVMANLNMVDRYDLDNPYDLVKDGTWTADKMLSMAADIPADLDGDADKWTNDDQYGIVVVGSSAKGFYYGFDKSIITMDKDGLPEWAMTPMYAQDAIEKVIELYNTRNITFNTQPTANRKSGMSHAKTAEAMFVNGQVLFEVCELIATQRQRGSAIATAVLPMPKYDLNQENYHCVLNDATFVSIPVLSSDPDSTSLILSAMARESIDTLTPAFYEKSLTSRYINDPKSVEMVSLILSSTRAPDIATTLDYGGFLTAIKDLAANNSSDFSSYYTKNIDRALTELDALIDRYK